jgi:hypothetical protein
VLPCELFSFARQFYGDEFYWGWGREEITQNKTRTGKRIGNRIPFQYIVIPTNAKENLMTEEGAQFSLDPYNRNIPEEELLQDLKDVSAKIGSDKPLRQADYEMHGKYSVSVFIKRFGNWSVALNRAEILISKNTLISEKSLFENLFEVWSSLGRQPRYSEIRKPLSRFHVKSYENRFGGFRTALEKFVEFANQKHSGLSELPEVNSEKTKGSRNINLRLRFRVLQRDHFKCVLCGQSPAMTPGLKLEIDHIVPWSKGGLTIEENLRSLCMACNQGRSNVL